MPIIPARDETNPDWVKCLLIYAQIERVRDELLRLRQRISVYGRENLRDQVKLTDKEHEHDSLREELDIQILVWSGEEFKVANSLERSIRHVMAQRLFPKAY